MKKSFIEFYQAMAEMVSLKSKDESTRVGAVIVRQTGEFVSMGFNGLCRGVNDSKDMYCIQCGETKNHPVHLRAYSGVTEHSYEDRHTRPEKYKWYEHAERNAIYNAARIGVSTIGTIMFLNCGVPCTDCARGIIQAGIDYVCCYPETKSGNADKWKKEAETSLIMLNEGGVGIWHYTMELVHMDIKFVRAEGLTPDLTPEQERFLAGL